MVCHIFSTYWPILPFPIHQGREFLHEFFGMSKRCFILSSTSTAKRGLHLSNSSTKNTIGTSSVVLSATYSWRACGTRQMWPSVWQTHQYQPSRFFPPRQFLMWWHQNQIPAYFCYSFQYRATNACYYFASIGDYVIPLRWLWRKPLQLCQQCYKGVRNSCPIPLRPSMPPMALPRISLVASLPRYARWSTHVSPLILTRQASVRCRKPTGKPLTMGRRCLKPT